MDDRKKFEKPLINVISPEEIDIITASGDPWEYASNDGFTPDFEHSLT